MLSIPGFSFPLTPDEFVKKIIENRTFFIEGTKKKFEKIFDIDKFFNAVVLGERDSPPGYRLSKFVKVKEGENHLVKSIQIRVKEIEEALDKGMTVCVTHIEVCDEAIAAIANQMVKELHLLGSCQVNCYLSPDNSGADLHFDNRMGITVQIAGQKKWKYSIDPFVEWPLSNAQLSSNGKPVWVSPLAGFEDWEKLDVGDAIPLLEKTMNPGDLLCVPAGAWHTAKAVEFSLALNFAFKPIDYFALINQLVYNSFQSDSKWRNGIPIFLDTDKNGFDDIIKHWDDRIDSLIKILEVSKGNREVMQQFYT